jgi:hypothetical protein
MAVLNSFLDTISPSREPAEGTSLAGLTADTPARARRPTGHRATGPSGHPANDEILLRPWSTAAPENSRSERGPPLSAGRPGRRGALLCAAGFRRPQTRRRAGGCQPAGQRERHHRRHHGNNDQNGTQRSSSPPSARPATPTEPAIPPRSLRSAAGNLAHPPQPSDPVHSSAWLPARARAVLHGQRRARRANTPVTPKGPAQARSAYSPLISHILDRGQTTVR